MRVVVGLIGFSGDGGARVRLDSPTLQRALSEALPIHTPANVQLGAAAHVQYHVSYEATHMPLKVLTGIEALLKQHMHFIGQTDDGISVYDIAAHLLEPQLDAFYASQFTPRLSAAELQRSEQAAPDETPTPLALLLLNPDKARMNPTASGVGAYMYRYRYEHGAATQQWVSRRRYIVADLSAGPCSYGAADMSEEGTVSIGSVPVVEVKIVSSASSAAEKAEENLASVKFTAQLSAFILSAVRHVFISDLQWRNLKYAEKVIVPIVVFRNHRRFHPLRQEGGMETLHESQSSDNGARLQLCLSRSISLVCVRLLRRLLR